MSNIAKISLNIGNVAALNITTKLVTNRCQFLQNNVTVSGINNGIMWNIGLVVFERCACYRQPSHVESNIGQHRTTYHVENNIAKIGATSVNMLC